MEFRVPTPEEEFKNSGMPEPGEHIGILVGVYDIGTSTSSPYAPRREAILVWELFEGNRTRMDAFGKPVTMFRFTGTTLGPKTWLRSFIETSARVRLDKGQAFNLDALLGSAARLTVELSEKRDGKTGPKITAVSPVAIGRRFNTMSDQTSFEITRPNCPIPRDTPQYIAKKIQQSYEYQGLKIPAKRSMAQPENDRFPWEPEAKPANGKQVPDGKDSDHAALALAAKMFDFQGNDSDPSQIPDVQGEVGDDLDDAV